MAQRAPLKKPFYVTVVDACGGFWDIFPWIGLVMYVARLFMQFSETPPIIAVLVLVFAAVWGPLYIFWLICDVLYTHSGWWWILIAWLCYPIGLFIYLMSGRQS